MTRMFTAAAIAALMAGSAMAQTSSNAMSEDQPPHPAGTGQGTMAEDGGPAASNVSDAGTMSDPAMAAPMDSAPMSDPAMSSAPMSDSMASGMASPAPMAGSTQMAGMTTSTVTNGPVPDTAENRAKYGSPMSNAGKRSKPAGN